LIGAWLAGLALLLPLASQATPDTPAVDAGNAVSRFLGERGLPDPAAAAAAAGAKAAPLVQQVRDGASDMVLSAMDFLGVPYRRGGNSAESGFDCSGFTRHIFEQSLGLVLPRRADQQARTAGLFAVQRDELKPGDLVFFNTLRRTFSHVGIYVGEGKFIHAPKPGGEVRIESMGDGYWSKRFTGARRAPQAPELSAANSMQSAAETVARSVSRNPAP
jgi:cell wall-associated NlpC family hydrolase